MICLQSRRLLLAAPREQTREHWAHISSCTSCARFARRQVELDRAIESAALVRAPDALPDYILLNRDKRSRWKAAVAAVCAVVSAAVGLLLGSVVEAPGFAGHVQAVGPSHPAIAAIAEVAGEHSELADKVLATAPSELQGLRRLGLSVRAGKANAYYVGKCHIAGSTDCEHMVLSTADAHADVIVVTGYRLPERVLVSDRRMVALVNPAGDGGYIVVADSATTAKRMERLLVRG